MTERVAIVGARVHPCLDIVADCVSLLPAGTVVVSGGAEGVDRCAVEQALGRGLRALEFPPQSPGFCLAKISGEPGHERVLVEDRDLLLYRNTLIALSDRMIVFPDGSRGGCWDAAREARRFRRPVEVWWYEPERTPRYRVEPYTGRQR